MGRCDDKMCWQTSTIRRNLRSDSLGKKRTWTGIDRQRYIETHRETQKQAQIHTHTLHRHTETTKTKTNIHTHKHIYKQTLYTKTKTVMDANAFTQKRCHTQMPFTHKVLCIPLPRWRFSSKVLQSLRKVLPSTTSYYKTCTKYLPVVLRTTRLAQSTSQ